MPNRRYVTPPEICKHYLIVLWEPVFRPTPALVQAPPTTRSNGTANITKHSVWCSRPMAALYSWDNESWTFTGVPFHAIWSASLQNKSSMPKSDENWLIVVDMFGFSFGHFFPSACCAIKLKYDRG
ncbi:hypothetical protein AVEN_227196-1 [Araneus ventricosus]|uniref:Uncharacterized protein n=1 Tax=Araneus ventricosus TaxID=182803 RepID=A0A4Y2U299_ARAVE|nr:hypothetical protein AVEN_227196-1 [Araneus ventricosus]